MQYAYWIKSGKDDLEITEKLFFQVWYYKACMWLWFHRPITFILRDFYHARPFWYHAVLFLVLALSGIIGNKLNLATWIGFLLGHLFG